MGGQLNAYTSREQTVYHAKVFGQDVPQAVDILADILQNSQLTESAIERERSTILREMREVESNNEEVMFDHLHSIAFQGTPLAYTILGPEENIRSINRANLLDYIRTHYTAGRMVLVGAGGVKHQQLVELAEKYFGRLPQSSPADYFAPPVSFSGSQLEIPDNMMQDVHCIVAIRSVGWSDPDYLVFMVLQALLGNWDIGMAADTKSHLSETLSQGLVQSYTTFHTPYHRIGLFGIYTVTNSESLPQIPTLIVQELARLSKNVTPAEVEHAKKKVWASLVLQLDDSYQVCEEIGRQFLTLGRRMPLAEAFARLSVIDSEVVKRVATQYLCNTAPSVVAMGSQLNLPPYDSLIDHIASL
eukprot:TRINITY_DN2444_c0_g1_i1.p1 TRINITY_DN2444_c0_g1~~TRINITY_DN2444_c0_g1_i1.p1  ORF type:complete len:359 (-),score=64.08 TRINITY_DN2444_c0_g1_i1:56-1132(-)